MRSSKDIISVIGDVAFWKDMNRSAYVGKVSVKMTLDEATALSCAYNIFPLVELMGVPIRIIPTEAKEAGLV